ncbi:hypothetical protein BXT86_01750 [candidate division WOR-3 bacterium 4484_100]|uniref:DUF4159 domain-containing protein n=1 Tax=candidate division WOR-3 bacterium 4484_100 TaxID=1936077 RepID=A0A1V4QG51_UNCW3|nr:MAG: hypothetical protein BXT86_01750 [candidate division WOR-3 bacterium 4484_100]
MFRLSLFMSNLLLLFLLFTGSYDFTIARLKYGGGGDWYDSPSALPNLLAAINERTSIRANPREEVVEITDPKLFKYPYLFMTGHGNIHFTQEEVKILREYFARGGFLHACDSYGMDSSFRREIKKVFPDSPLVEIPFDHPIYHSFYDFPKGLPKIHKHNGKPPQGFGIFYEGRLVVFYDYECDLADGWEDADVYNDPSKKRESAFRMGINIVVYALTH